MNSDAPSPRLIYLLSRLSDGLLDPAEAEELNGTLLKDADARAYYRCHAAVHYSLSTRALDSEKVVDIPATRHSPRWPAFAAAAAVILAGGTAWWSLRGGSQNQQPPLAGPTTDAEPVAAVTSAAENVHWNIAAKPEGGQSLRPGIVQVFEGDLSLSLVDGQVVQVRGPAEFELLANGEFSLRKGSAAFRTIGSQAPFIVHLPKGALVDTGSVFSAKVGPDGAAEVRVFEKQLTVSTVGNSGRTLEEAQLLPGQSILVSHRLTQETKPATSFLRIPPVPISAPPGSDDSYAARVVDSNPVAYWRFETLDSAREVPDEMGKFPLQLMEKARLGGSGRQHYLMVNTGDASGFATTREGLQGLDTSRGVTMECLLFSSNENYGTAMAFELSDPAPRSLRIPTGIHHAPQTMVIERMGRKGEHIGHIHPDFALRTMLRSPAGYIGGTNVYSRESHLLHRWIHVAAVHDHSRILLYVDGKLSDSAPVSRYFDDESLRPIIGRLQPNPRDEQRQWIGGIDEVAIYGHALTAAEIRAHAAALQR